MQIVRNVLIVDDSENVGREIQRYQSIFRHISERNKLAYSLEFTHERNYEQAIELLKSKEFVWDVLMTDFDLSLAGNNKDGIDLVTEVRNSINKHCKIIFYTMGELSTVFPNREDLVRFFNKGIYRLLPKDFETTSTDIFGPKAHQLRVETMIEAIDDIDFIQAALERYFIEYHDVIEDELISVNGEQFSIPEIIKSLKQDTEAGRVYKQNLADSIILHNLLNGGKK